MPGLTLFTLNDEEVVHIDLQLLFQRLVIAGSQADRLAETFKCELCGYPPALFETKTVLLPVNKPQIAKAIWNAVPHDDVPERDILVVDDTNLLILLLLLYQQGELYFMSEPKKSSLSSCRLLNIGHARDVLGEDVSNSILVRACYAWL